MAKLTSDDVAALKKLEHEAYVHASSAGMSMDEKQRARLKRAGLIESWRPAYKNMGKRSPWRLTDAGRAALANGDTNADT